MIHKNSRVVAACEDGILCAAIIGEIDHHGAAALREELDDVICRERPKKVMLDLSAVDFMDSSGLGIIMGRKATASKLGCAFSLLNPTGRVARIIELSGLCRIIDIEYSTSGGNKK